MAHRKTRRQLRGEALGIYAPDITARKKWRRNRKPTIAQQRHQAAKEAARIRRLAWSKRPPRRVTGVLTMGQHGMPHWLHKKLREGTAIAEEVAIVWHESGLIDVRDDYTCKFKSR